MQTSSLCTRSLNQGRRLRDFSTAYDARSRLPNLAKSPQRRELGQGDTAIDWRVGAGALSQARQHQVTVGGACRATGEVPREQMLVLFGAATMHAPGKPTGCPRTPPASAVRGRVHHVMGVETTAYEAARRQRGPRQTAVGCRVQRRLTSHPLNAAPPTHRPSGLHGGARVADSRLG